MESKLCLVASILLVALLLCHPLGSAEPEPKIFVVTAEGQTRYATLQSRD